MFIRLQLPGFPPHLCSVHSFRFNQILLFSLWFCGRVVCGLAEELPDGLEVHEYTGWKDSVFLHAADTSTQVVMVPAVGGRIVHFSLENENILFENPVSQGRTLGANLEDLWLGGYQCDIGPELRGIPPHPQLLQGPHSWLARGDFAIKETSPPDAVLGVTLEKEFVMAPDTGDLGVVQRLRNTSKREVSYCLWDRSLCKGGGFALAPINPRSKFKAGWAIKREKDGKSYYDGDHPDAFEAQAMEGVLVVQTSGPVTRLGLDSDAGWIAYTHGKLLFVKYYPCWPGARYSDGGNSVEIYFDQRATELAPISPEITLAPGHSLMFPEKWVLLQLSKEITTREDARLLVKRIPPSPFGRNEPLEEPSVKRP